MMTRDEAAALGSCTLKKKEGGFKAAVKMMILIKLSIEKKHDQGDVVDALLPKRVTLSFLCLLFVFFLASPSIT